MSSNIIAALGAAGEALLIGVAFLDLPGWVAWSAVAAASAALGAMCSAALGLL